MLRGGGGSRLCLWGQSMRVFVWEGTCPGAAPRPWAAPWPPLPLCLPSAIKGWFSPYHRKRQFGNPRNMETFGSKVLKYVVLGAG